MAPRLQNYYREKKELFGKRKSYVCHWCSERLTFKKSTIDHLIPLCIGGTNDIANLVIACQPCNTKRGGWQQWLAYERQRERVIEELAKGSPIPDQDRKNRKRLKWLNRTLTRHAADLAAAKEKIATVTNG